MEKGDEEKQNVTPRMGVKESTSCGLFASYLPWHSLFRYYGLSTSFPPVSTELHFPRLTSLTILYDAHRRNIGTTMNERAELQKSYAFR